MAFIGTIRNKLGVWVGVFVFVAILLFILGDIFSGNSSLLTGGRNNVGEIAGETITYDEFMAAVQEREANYFLNFGRQPGEREMNSLRQQAWDMLISRHAIQKQYEKVGIEVTEAEVWDMIQGKNVDENVRTAFTNPETGEFDKDRVVGYLQQLKTQPRSSEMRIRWDFFEKDLAPARERIKYENLLLKTQYVTKAEAAREYHLQNDVAEIKYLYIPYYSVSDSVEVSDAALKEYYEKNKEKFKTDEIRDIKYVTVDVSPSAQDSADVREFLQRTVAEFKSTQDDSLYATSVSTAGSVPYGRYNMATLPPSIDPDQLIVGNIIGPIKDQGSFKVIKVAKVFDDTVAVARARHILIKPADATPGAKAAAKEKAQEILQNIKGGADFAQQARQFSMDGSASSGGDLGWFSFGQMVKPFQDAVFNAQRTGLVNNVVETDFGYHIIDVTGTKTTRGYELAIVEQAIIPGEGTLNEAYRLAENFAAEADDIQSFESKARELFLPVQEANGITPSDRRVGTLGEARNIVQWLFKDASKGDVSEVFELDNQYVVAIMTNRIEKGYKPLEAVKSEILPAVRNEVKGDIIVKKLEGKKGTLEETAQALGNDAVVHNSADLKLSSNSLPSVGFEPQAVGLAFSLEDGKRSEPVKGENGVLVLELQNKTIVPEIADYSDYKNQVNQAVTNRAAFGIAEAIKANADIEDKRYKFF